MKKKILIPLAILAVFSMHSCIKENEYHRSLIYYPYAGRALVYADQPTDSIYFASTESWLLLSSQTWCTIPSGRQSLDNPYANTLVDAVVTLSFEPNTTGAWRSVDVTVRADEYSVASRYYQSPFHELIRPGVSNDEQGFPSEINLLTDSAHVLTDSLHFVTHANWTLSAKDGTWLTPESTSGEQGDNKVMISLTPNTSTTDRTDTLLLMSSGVTTPIAIRQLGKVLQQ
ncbi:MAG: hypothetical protein K6F94_01310 [Bacteroidaceae bacterium]|nr:hypothetical protein [Bacteroidaceae bacterium]